MDSIDTIGLFFDYEYFNNTIGPNGSIDWRSGLELYENNYVAECLPPNKEFNSHKALLYKYSLEGKPLCELDNWITPITKDSYDHLIKSYLFSDITDKIDYRQTLFKENLNNFAQYSPDDLEKLLVAGDLDLHNFLLNAPSIDAKQELKPEFINYLKEVLNPSAEGNNNTMLVELSAKLLTVHVLHFDKDHQHQVFLIDLLKNDNFNANTKEIIFKKFAQEVPSIVNWNASEFDNFASLLPYDSKAHDLAQGLLSAAKNHDYTANIILLPHFEKLLDLDNPLIKKEASDFINKSLEKLLCEELLIKSDSKIDGTDKIKKIDELEKHIINLYKKTGELTHSLINTLFEFYKEDQSHFNNLIVDLVAQYQHLPKELLSKLIPSLITIKNPKNALFLATKITQHPIDLPIEILKHFIPFLTNEDSQVNTLAINLYLAALNKIPNEIHSELAESLLLLIQKTNKENKTQFTNIESILNTLKLNEDQILSYNSQKEIFNWHQAETLEEKLQISQNLYNNINEKTADLLIPCFKEHVFSQNVDLLLLAKSAFEKLEKLGKTQDSIWKEEEKKSLILLEVVDKDPETKAQKNIFELPINNSKFLVNLEQLQNLNKQFDAFPWHVKEFVKEYINHINFTHIRQLEELFSSTLIKESIKELFGDQFELSKIEEKILKNSFEYLVNKIKWPAAFLFTVVMANSKQGSLPKLIPILEKMADYKVDPESINKKGATAISAFQNLPLEQLSEAINEIISDNHNYVIKDIKTLLEELSESNINDSKIQDLIKDKYFVEQLLKIEYLLEVTEDKPNNPESNKLYLYKNKENNNLYLATDSDTKLITDITEEESKKLNELTENTHLLTKSEENFIFKKAAQLGIVSQSKDIKPVLRGVNKALSEWETDDFLAWRNTITNIDDDNIAEVIAVLSEAAHKELFKKSNYPRAIQMISLLALFKSRNGKLAEIATGEGKSLIVAMFATIKALEQGYENRKQIDIVTSSSVLAMRDAEEFKDFYKQFGLTVSHNIDESMGNTPKTCYAADIVYGDLRHFIGDGLRDTFKDTKLGRGFNIIIVDEVDNLFIDQNNMKIQLTGKMPGYEALLPIFVYMYGTALAIASNLKQIGNHCYEEKPILTEAQKSNVTDCNIKQIEKEEYETELIPTNSSCGEHIKSKLKDFTEPLLFAFNVTRLDRSFIIPRHLEEFAQSQLDKWLDTLLSAYDFQEKVDYIIHNPPENERDSFRKIEPVDYGNTGVVQHSLQWSNGLHQFLQIKHKLTMIPENVVSIFMSYVGFFNKYKGNIYGVTGTLGERPHHEFLEKVYGVELTIFPTFIKKDLNEFPPIVVQATSQWLEEILGVLKRKIEGSRACLIILETIAGVEYLKQFLEQSGYNKNQIFVYGTTEKKEYDVEKKRELQAGDVIIATNLAGRGTDLKISAEVKKNGGLHVIMAEFSSSVRVQNQGYGRGARQGEPGSAQLIINLEKNPETLCTNIDCLKAERSEQEIEKLETDRLCKLPSLAIRDQLFDLFVETIREADSPTGFKLIAGKSENKESKSLYVYSEHNQIKLEIVQGAQPGIEINSKIIDITELLETLDPYSAKHIKNLLSNKNLSPSSFNNLDYEIIHFIATSKGYTEYPKIYERIEKQFDKQVKKEGSNKNAYLAQLLKNDIYFADLFKKNNTTEKINKALLDKTEIRTKYFLWIKNRDEYNNKFEIQQVTENFGRWSIKHDELFGDLNNCEISNETQRQTYYQSLENIKPEFEQFKNKIDDKKNKGILFENPYYPVLKAWQYFKIYLRQSEHKESEKQESTTSTTWYQTIVNTVNDFLQRISFGGENYDPPPNILVTAMQLLKNATKLDDIYAWTAHNAMAYIGLVKDGEGITKVKQADEALKVKKAFIARESKAIDNIEKHVIPIFEAQLSFGLVHKMFGPSNDITIQLIGNIELYKKIVSVKKNNIQIAIKSSNKEMIDLGNFVPLKDLIENINITETIIKGANKTGGVENSAYGILNKLIHSGNLTAKDLQFKSKSLILDQTMAQGGYLFELSSYELETNSNGWGTLLVVAIGVASIATGLWMIGAFGATSIFAATLGSSLVIQGVGDLIQSLISVVSDTPIQLQSYFKAKGMSTGIALATAGMLHVANMLPVIQNLGFIQSTVTAILNQAAEGTKYVITAIAVQGTTTIINWGLSKATERLIQPEDVASEANEEIDKIILSNKRTLNRLYATDEINGNTKLQGALHEKIENQARKYQQRFQDAKTRFGTEVGINIANEVANVIAIPFGLKIIDPATRVTMGAIKNAQAMDRFSKFTKQAIKEMGSKASNSASLMKILLHKEFGETQANELYTQISTQGHIEKGEIKYNECNKLEKVNLPETLSNLKQRMILTCEKVGKTILKGREGETRRLKDKFISATSSVIAAIQKYEILGPIIGTIGGAAGGKFGSKTAEFAHERFKNAKGRGENGGYSEEPWYKKNKNSWWSKGSKKGNAESNENANSGENGNKDSGEQGNGKEGEKPGGPRNSENSKESKKTENSGKSEEPKQTGNPEASGKSEGSEKPGHSKENANQNAGNKKEENKNAKQQETNTNNGRGSEEKKPENTKSEGAKGTDNKDHQSRENQQPGQTKTEPNNEPKNNANSAGPSEKSTPEPTGNPTSSASTSSTPKVSSGHDTSLENLRAETPRTNEGPSPKTEDFTHRTDGTEIVNNFAYDSRNTITEIDGKQYILLEESKKIFSADGKTVIKEEILIQAIEIKNENSPKNADQKQSGLNLETSADNHRVTILIDIDGGMVGLQAEAVEMIQNGVRGAFASNEGTGKNFIKIKIKNDGNNLPSSETNTNINANRIHKEEVKIADFANPTDKKVPENIITPGGGMIGCGLLSVEDGQQMKDFLVSKIWPKTKEITSEILNNPQVQGTLNLADGIGEMLLGQTLIIVGAPTIIGSAVGGILVLHGADQISKALMQLITNQPQESVTVVALKESGFSPNVAEIIDNGIGIAGSLNAGVKIYLKSGGVAEEILEKVVKDIGKTGQKTPEFNKKNFDFPKEKYPKKPELSGDHTPLVPGGGLEFHETLKGHTLEKHVGKSIDYLKTRFIEKPNMQYSSTFYDRSTAEKVISRAIYDDKIKIAGWLKNPKQPDLELRYQHHTSLGIRIARNSDTIENIDTCWVILSKTPNNPLGYYIKTAYPKK